MIISDMSSLSKFAARKYARTHDEARAVICCVCGKKVKLFDMKVVNERVSNLVRQFVYDSYSIHNNSHPTAICGTCRITLYAFEKVFCIFLAPHPKKIGHPSGCFGTFPYHAKWLVSEKKNWAQNL